MSHAIIINSLPWGISELKLYVSTLSKLALQFYRKNFLVVPREVVREVKEMFHKEDEQYLLDHLPRDCMVYILNFLDRSDIIKVQAVNKAWYNLCSSDFIWRNYYKARFSYYDTKNGNTVTKNYKDNYRKRLYELQYEPILRYRKERNYAFKYALVKSWGGGLLAVVPVYMILSVTQPWHLIPNVRTRISFGLILTSACFQDFFDKMSTQKETLEPTMIRCRTISRLVLGTFHFYST